ncbi:DEKNAAE104771 [Brettanomyces naardenensis]|uniref:DEKNAAE104772 n=1 Tax=Brettanomyces naardenensis TaxID=13370 RepID=A0A448YR41_BRENA|nr:DEKNAAE104771 [Brettanomyces naardenensis]
MSVLRKMAQISVGAKLPLKVKLGFVPYTPEHENICSIGRPLQLDLSTIQGKKVVIVAAPGAFTPTCTERHIPPFVSEYSKLKAKGIDDIFIVTTDNPFVQAAWGKALGNKGQLKFVSDPKGTFSAQLGLANLDGDDYVVARTLRYALVVDDGVVKYVGVEHGGSLDSSTLDAVLKFLN